MSFTKTSNPSYSWTSTWPRSTKSKTMMMMKHSRIKSTPPSSRWIPSLKNPIFSLTKNHSSFPASMRISTLSTIFSPRSSLKINLLFKVNINKNITKIPQKLTSCPNQKLTILRKIKKVNRKCIKSTFQSWPMHPIHSLKGPFLRKVFAKSQTRKKNIFRRIARCYPSRRLTLGLLSNRAPNLFAKPCLF